MSAYWIVGFIVTEEICEGLALPATCPLQRSHPSLKTSRPHDLSSFLYPVHMPRKLHSVFFTGSFFSAGHQTSFSSNTCLGLWLWRHPCWVCSLSWTRYRPCVEICSSALKKWPDPTWQNGESTSKPLKAKSMNVWCILRALWAIWKALCPLLVSSRINRMRTLSKKSPWDTLSLWTPGGGKNYRLSALGFDLPTWSQSQWCP